MAGLNATRPLPLAEVDGREWSQVEFISDVHLQRSENDTFLAWSHYMQSVHADALFILGDLFEVWVGDDLLDNPEGAFELNCLNMIRNTAQRLPVFCLVGNRDFLMGEKAWVTAGVQPLHDPCVLQTKHQRFLLSHGDELCSGDVDYQLFRRQVRSTHWQHDFLNKPLPERMQIARGLRQQSEVRKATQHQLVDIDSGIGQAWLKQHQCSTLVHGHTHQAAQHRLGPGDRWVLSDWDATSQPPRLQSLQWRTDTGFSPLPIKT